MNTQALLSSPFAQMLAPEDVFRALRESQTLHRLQTRICRPLDKSESLTPALAAQSDAEIDALPEDAEDAEDASPGF
jgi:hypothetical protein